MQDEYLSSNAMVNLSSLPVPSQMGVQAAKDIYSGKKEKKTISIKLKKTDSSQIEAPRIIKMKGEAHGQALRGVSPRTRLPAMPGKV